MRSYPKSIRVQIGECASAAQAEKLCAGQKSLTQASSGTKRKWDRTVRAMQDVEARR